MRTEGGDRIVKPVVMVDVDDIRRPEEAMIIRDIFANPPGWMPEDLGSGPPPMQMSGVIADDPPAGGEDPILTTAADDGRRIVDMDGLCAEQREYPPGGQMRGWSEPEWRTGEGDRRRPYKGRDEEPIFQIIDYFQLAAVVV